MRSKKRKIIFIAFCALTLFGAAGCFSTRVENSVSALDAAQRRQHFYLLGLLGEAQVDLGQECPRGAAAFADRFTLGDIGYTLLTLGIYSPKSVFVRCET
ncbi:MAG: hypothetical protein J5J00_01830 [Deltaproteobacteria bacterium]|nr:hypothetical protein [Deltaproteobacteria bacterium]